MAVTINGDGTISGISVGGLPTGSVTADTLAANSVNSAELIDGAVDNSHLATGIDATKLADGTITNSELQYINSLSSNAQTQISAAGADGAGVSSFFSGFTSANNNITGDATYWNATSAAWTDLYNVGSDFNSGTYTAPQTGKYLLWGQWYMSGFTSSHNDLMCRLNTSNRTYRPILIHPWAIRPAATAVTINWSIIADMDISDTATIDIKVSGGTKVVDLHGDGTYQSQFTCYGGSLLA